MSEADYETLAHPVCLPPVVAKDYWGWWLKHMKNGLWHGGGTANLPCFLCFL